MPSSRRRIAAVLFLDVVGSTALASEVGDARFKLMLTGYWRIVRSRARAGGGRLQDPAGDGVLIVFSEPVAAIRTAAAIISAVQTLGVDVRCGVHVGECEVVDGRLRGVGVHTGARVMALAGPAELLVTRTVVELVAGATVNVETHGTHELKGVPGTRELFRVSEVEGAVLPPPLDAETRTARLSVLAPTNRRFRRRSVVVVSVFLAAGAGGVAAWLTLARGNEHAAASQPRVSVLELDRRGALERIVRDVHGPVETYDTMGIVDGTLWQAVLGQRQIVGRSVLSGRVKMTFTFPRGTFSWGNGLGAIWGLTRRGRRTFVRRIDPLSRRSLLIPMPRPFAVSEGYVHAGPTGVWVIAGGLNLVEVDPTRNRVRGTYALPEPVDYFVAHRGYLWLLPPASNYLLRFDPRAHRTRRFELTEQPWDVLDAAAGGIWIFDRANATLSELDPQTGSVGRSFGLAGTPQSAAAGGGVLWVAAGRVVQRVDAVSGLRSTFKMPRGVWAGNIAVDDATGNVWVGNSVRAPTG